MYNVISCSKCYLKKHTLNICFYFLLINTRYFLQKKKSIVQKNNLNIFKIYIRHVKELYKNSSISFHILT